MTPDEFQQVVVHDPHLSGAIVRAAVAGPAQRFGVGVTEAAAVVLMFPLVQFVLRQPAKTKANSTSTGTASATPATTWCK